MLSLAFIVILPVYFLYVHTHMCYCCYSVAVVHARFSLPALKSINKNGKEKYKGQHITLLSSFFLLKKKEKKKKKVSHYYKKKNN